MKITHKNHLKAFTLVELSIVIIVIALLISGVVGGRELYNVSKLNSLAGQMRQMAVATNAFITKYNSYPGDMKDATEYWPDEVKNGDGNDLIIYTDLETFNAFLMLKKSEIYDQTSNEDFNYDGAAQPGVQLPQCEGLSSCMLALAIAGGGVNANGTRKPIKNSIITSGATTNYFPGFNNRVLTDEQGEFIDKKIDDGNLETGILRLYGNAGNIFYIIQ
jgi:prepilin-type N-terminal cleavage/methylation domain-containing protein